MNHAAVGTGDTTMILTSIATAEATLALTCTKAPVGISGTVRLVTPRGIAADRQIIGELSGGCIANRCIEIRWLDCELVGKLNMGERLGRLGFGNLSF
jgi:hypothetical protein